MASKKERNRLAAQAWMAQTETDWRQGQEEKARQDEDFRIELPKWTEAEALLQLAGQMKRSNDLQEKEFHAIAGLGFLYALQCLLIWYLIWKAVR